MQLENGSEMFKNWANPSMDLIVKVYFFNITNADEFYSEKKKPVFEEIGPYVYK